MLLDPLLKFCHRYRLGECHKAALPTEILICLAEVSDLRVGADA